MFSKDVSSTARYLYRTALPTDVKMSPAFAIVNAGAGFVMDALFMPYADKMIQVNGFSGWEPPPTATDDIDNCLRRVFEV